MRLNQSAGISLQNIVQALISTSQFLYSRGPALVASDVAFLELNYSFFSKGGLNYIESKYSKLLVSNTAFVTSNRARVPVLYGGAAHFLFTQGEFRNCTFESNYGYEGGAVYAAQRSSVRFIDCLFQSNLASASGGAINLVYSTAFVERCVLSANRAIIEFDFVSPQAFGGAIYSSGSLLHVSNSNLTNNYAESSGGALVQLLGSSSFESTIFEGNLADGDGAAINFLAGIFLMRNVTFRDSDPHSGDGTVYVTGGSGVFERAIFRNCSSRGNGAGVFVASGTINVTDSVFQNNFVDGYGAAAFLTSGTILFTRVLFLGNVAMVGGAVTVVNATTTMEGVVFELNRTNRRSGTVVVFNGQVRVTNSSFISNVGNTLGAVALLLGGSMSIDNSYLTENVGQSGTVGHVAGGMLKISASSLFENFGTFGTVLFVSGGAALVEGCAISNSSGGSSSGSQLASVVGGRVTFRNSFVEGDLASGVFISVDSDGHFEAINSSFQSFGENFNRDPSQFLFAASGATALLTNCDARGNIVATDATVLIGLGSVLHGNLTAEVNANATLVAAGIHGTLSLLNGAFARVVGSRVHTATIGKASTALFDKSIIGQTCAVETKCVSKVEPSRGATLVTDRSFAVDDEPSQSVAVGVFFSAAACIAESDEGVALNAVLANDQRFGGIFSSGRLGQDANCLVEVRGLAGNNQFVSSANVSVTLALTQPHGSGGERCCGFVALEPLKSAYPSLTNMVISLSGTSVPFFVVGAGLSNDMFVTVEFFDATNRERLTIDGKSFSFTAQGIQQLCYDQSSVRSFLFLCVFDAASLYSIEFHYTSCPTAMAGICAGPVPRGKLPSVVSLAALVVPSVILVIAASTAVFVAAVRAMRRRREKMTIALLENFVDLKHETNKTISGDRVNLGALLDKDLLIPLEDIEILYPIGAGATGSVSLGLWRGGRVAVKQLFALMVCWDMFTNEVIMHKRLRHPNIVQLIGVCPHPPCVVTEFMDRGTLYATLHSSVVISHAQTLGFLIDIASGMMFLHSAGVVHRDLKSLNVLVDASWRCKISDFGLSTAFASTLTSNVGTLHWTAPVRVI